MSEYIDCMKVLHCIDSFISIKKMEAAALIINKILNEIKNPN